MKLSVPVSPQGSLTAWPYNTAPEEPGDWLLMTYFESSSEIKAIAAFDGKVSAVPPWEMNESWSPVLKDPSTSVDFAGRLYLTPMVAWPDWRHVNAEMKAAGLGDSIRAIVYDNIQVGTIPQEDMLSYAKTPQAPPHLKTATSATMRGLFVDGEFAVQVPCDQILATGAKKSDGKYLIGIGVLTTTGFVDPAAFFELLASALKLESTDPVPVFWHSVGSTWGVMKTKDNVDVNGSEDVVSATGGRLYPAPVLYWARKHFALSDAAWRAVGDAQKKLYWHHLRNQSIDGPPSGEKPGFRFLTDDMTNPFQLEAVTEFFLSWREPRTLGLDPGISPPVHGSVNYVDLMDDSAASPWKIVIIDPFRHDFLSVPDLPKPDFYLNEYKNLSAADLCVAPPLQPHLPLGADKYDAVLFLVVSGVIRAWYRWNTYSSHKHEIAKHGNCSQASSIVGNIHYQFTSSRAQSTDKKFINFAFAIKDPKVWPEVVFTPPDKRAANGRYYFRDGAPLDDNGKRSIMIHFGHSADSKHKGYGSSGSAGCIVSPRFYSFRDQVLQILKELDSEGYESVRRLFGKTKSQSESMFTSHDLYDPNEPDWFKQCPWNGLIRGDLWIIRPDEPSLK